MFFKRLPLCVLLLIFCGCTEPYIEDSAFMLDTLVSVRLYGSRNKQLPGKSLEYIAELESQSSRYISGSDISRINDAPGTAVKISEPVFALIEKSVEFARLSGGAFDPSVGPLVSLWGIGTDNARVPGQYETEQILALVDYRNIMTDAQNHTVKLNLPGMVLDTGGIGKGWIADQVISFLQREGEQHILLDLGGNIVVAGGKPDGSDFKIGMQDPFSDRGEYLGIFTLSDGAVVSSGIYERYFESDGIRYHHILNTSDGYPVRNGLAAVTVLAESSADADALSTAVFVLGAERGSALANRLDGVEAACVMQNGRIILTPGAAEVFEPANPETEMTIYTQSFAE